MKISKIKLIKLISESINKQRPYNQSVAQSSELLISILVSFEEMGYTMDEVPMWEVLSAMEEKIDVNPGLYHVYKDSIEHLISNPESLMDNEYFGSKELINVLKKSLYYYDQR